MTEVAAKKKAASKANHSAAHPPTAVMVTEALKTLKDRKGVSLQAVKKFIGLTYFVDVVKLAPFIRRFLLSAIEAGTILLTQGTGASGRFKLNTEVLKPVKASKSKVKETAKVLPASSKTTATKKARTTPKLKSPSKGKKSTTVPTKVAKSPKPKKAAMTKTTKAK